MKPKGWRQSSRQYSANNTTMSQPSTLLLPSNVLAMARETFGKVEESLKVAKLVAGGNYVRELPSKADIVEQTKAASRMETMLTNMIAAIARVHGV